MDLISSRTSLGSARIVASLRRTEAFGGSVRAIADPPEALQLSGLNDTACLVSQ